MNFDPIARYYDLLASLAFLGAIKRCQVDLLKANPPEGDVLIIGGGTGWIIRAIFQYGRVNRLVYIEHSAKMLDLAKKNCPLEHRDRVEFVHGDEHNIPQREFNAIITHFFLDCFEERRLKNVIEKLRSHLKSNGHWYVADFRISKSASKGWQRLIVRLMYWFFRKTAQLNTSTLQDYGGFLRQVSMQLVRKNRYYFDFIESAVYKK